MLPKQTVSTISLIVTFTVETFEYVSTQFFFWSFKLWRVGLKAGFTALCYISVVFEFVRSIVFLTFGPICLVYECGMSPFPVVFALRDV